MELSKYTKYKQIKNGLPKYEIGKVDTSIFPLQLNFASGNDIYKMDKIPSHIDIGSYKHPSYVYNPDTYSSNKNKFNSDVLNGISNIVGGVIKSFHLGDISVDQLKNEQPSTYENVGGYGYMKKSLVGNDYAKQLNNLGIENMINTGMHGIDLGTLLNKKPEYKCGKLPKHAEGINPIGWFTSGVGTILSGFGLAHSAGKLSNRVAQANREITRENDYGYTGSVAKLLQQLAAENLGDSRLLQLPWYSIGRLPKKRVITPFGDEFLPADSKVSPKEGLVAFDKNNNVIAYNDINDRGPANKKDNLLANIGDGAVLDAKSNLYFKATGDINGALNMVAMNQLKNKDGNGKLLKAADGAPGNAFTHSLKTIANTFDLIRNISDKPYQINTKDIANNISDEPINKLYSLRLSMYPIIPNIYGLLYKGNRAIDNSGALRASLRTAAKMKLFADTQKGMWDAMFQTLLQNNNYIAGAAQADLQKRLHTADLLSKNAQFDSEFNARSASARNNKITQNIKNYLDIADSYLANNTKWNTYMGMKSLYEDQNNIDREKIRILAKQYGITQ